MKQQPPLRSFRSRPNSSRREYLAAARDWRAERDHCRHRARFCGGVGAVFATFLLILMFLPTPATTDNSAPSLSGLAETMAAVRWFMLWPVAIAACLAILRCTFYMSAASRAAEKELIECGMAEQA